MADLLPKIRVTDQSREIAPGGRASPASPPSGTSKSSTSSRLRRQSATPAHLSHAATVQNGARARQEVHASIDPHSENIVKRTNTDSAAATGLLTSPFENMSISSGSAAQSPADPKHPVETSSRVDSFGSTSNVKDKKKGVSFLSRFIGNKKKGLDDEIENGSEAGDFRPEGMDAPVFSQPSPVENIGFNPRYPRPPAYIKFSAKHAKEREFNRVFLAQQLRPGRERRARKSTSQGDDNGTSGADSGAGNPIWAMEFSKDGKHLAAAGQDKIVRVWTVISTQEERRQHEMEEDASAENSAIGEHAHLSAPVFRKKPAREYEGHTGSILDLSWSKNNFLLSSSMDKTVRLWHISRSECLCTFKHTDFVPAIQFHPRDDRFFLAGSLDEKLRLWSIPDKSVAYSAQVPDMVTAVAFTPDGKNAIAGTLKGLCILYETDGLKLQSQQQVRSAHGKNAKPTKITGIQAMTLNADDSSRGDVKLLISSNDSRVRLYNFKGMSGELKFKGHVNNQSQIRASFSDDARYVICGSEDRKAFVWSLAIPEGAEKRDKRPVEMFEANTAITTSAIFAPTKTKQLLSKGEDPIFDLCNPPPVTLVSKTEGSHTPEQTGTEHGSVTATPTATDTTFKRAEETPAYLSRAAHPNGNIIVTADYHGAIKIFRQDCAYMKRIRAENWDAASTFSKKTASGILRRRGSVATTINSGDGSTKRNSGIWRADSNGTQPPQDRIMSWRQGVHPGAAAASNGSLDQRNRASKVWSTRSNSPRKSMVSVGQTSRNTSTSQLRPESGLSISTPAIPQNDTTTTLVASSGKGTETPTTTASSSPKKAKATPDGRKNSNPLMLVGNQSNLFWDKASWKRQVEHSGAAAQQQDHLDPRPLMLTQTSTITMLSSERDASSGPEGSSVYDSADDGVSRGEGALNTCRKCSGTGFKSRQRTGGKGRELVCERCGTAV